MAAWPALRRPAGPSSTRSTRRCRARVSREPSMAAPCSAGSRSMTQPEAARSSRRGYQRSPQRRQRAERRHPRAHLQAVRRHRIGRREQPPEARRHQHPPVKAAPGRAAEARDVERAPHDPGVALGGRHGGRGVQRLPVGQRAGEVRSAHAQQPRRGAVAPEPARTASRTRSRVPSRAAKAPGRVRHGAPSPPGALPSDGGRRSTPLLGGVAPGLVAQEGRRRGVHGEHLGDAHRAPARASSSRGSAG